ncbi:MAG: PIN domain-containing protein, partial [Candidatus Omnitrophica bacterium]|nr:PIN domain-containing protein [Candidatus Omnitrophota bacterium]
MENIAIIDAGPLIALFDKSDKYHQKTKCRLGGYRQSVHGKLVATWPIIAEAAYILKAHVHLEAQLDFLKWINLGGVEIFDLTKEHLSRIIELQKKYSDIPMDFADATLLITAETLNISKVFSIDKDFF